MPCPHRYLGLHLSAMLFPDWEIDYLFVGTFNPAWNRPNAVNAAYFYGRSAYFWDLVSILFEDRSYPYDRDDRQAMVDFCKLHRIGFTDLIYSVEDADWEIPLHREWIYSVRDVDLERFGNIAWNTGQICAFLAAKRPAQVYFTLLSTDKKSLFSPQIAKIEQQVRMLGLNTGRLHSPTGAMVGSGVPRLHELLERWSRVPGLPQVDLSKYPFEENAPRTRKKQKQKPAKNTAGLSRTSGKEILVMGRYGLSLDDDERVCLVESSTNRPLKAITVIREVIIPYISVTFGHQIDLQYATKARNFKNTRDLGREVYRFLMDRELDNGTH